MANPQIVDVGTAIKLYHSKIQLTRSDISTLFGTHTHTVLTRLKKMAVEQMKKDNAPIWDASMVDTESAYKAWGLDIDKLERRYAKLKKFGMLEGEEETNDRKGETCLAGDSVCEGRRDPA